MFDLFGMLVSGVISGGATGLLGVIIQRWFDFKNKNQEIEIVKLNLANAIELSKLESERVGIKAKADVDISDNQVEIQSDQTDSQLMITSYQSDSAQYLDKLSMRKKGWVANTVMLMMASVDFVRGLLRPGMTIYLCILVTMMFAWAKELANSMGMQMTTEQVTSFINQIIATVLYVFTTITLWWFGSRPPKTNIDK
jgi:hypothetical protein